MVLCFQNTQILEVFLKIVVYIPIFKLGYRIEFSIICLYEQIKSILKTPIMKGGGGVMNWRLGLTYIH